MLTNKLHYSLVFHLVFFSLYELALGTEVRLQPIDTQVDIGSWATFNCSISCELDKTHTVRWFVGSSRRRFVDSPPNFYRRTGIQVVLETLTSCVGSPEGMALYQLRVNATSMNLVNKASVQCAALRKAEIYSDIYSHYGVISVNALEASTVPHTEDEVSTSASPPIEPTQTVVVTKIVTVTVTATPTNIANPSRQTLCNGAQTKTSSLILTLCLLFVTLSASLFFR